MRSFYRPPTPKFPRRSPRATYALNALLASVLLGALLYRWQHWSLYLTWLIVVNLVTLVFFRLDKNRAGRGAERIPEQVLIFVTLLGGALGALAGMVLPPRHKTHKTYFWAAAATSLLIHLWLLWSF